MHDLLMHIEKLRIKDDYEGIYDIVEKQLQHKSDDIELWIGLGIAIIRVPIVDCEKSIACLSNALTIDNNNPIALIVLTHVYKYNLGGIDDMLLHQIKNLYTNSNEINSMLKYVASWSYNYTGKQYYDQEEALLKESISLYDGHVWNYVKLADLYLQQKRYLEVNCLIRKALSNIKKIYYGDELNIPDSTIDEYINEHVKGIYITDINVDSIQKRLLPKYIIVFYTIVMPLSRLYNLVKEEIFGLFEQ